MRITHADFHILSILACLLLAACNTNTSVVPAEDIDTPGKAQTVSQPVETDLPLDQIKLPPGFKIDIFAENVTNARSLCRTESGTVFVGTRNEGDVYALRDEDGDMRADKMYTIATGLRMPNGVAFKDGDLYVAEVSRVLRFRDIELQLADPPQPEVVVEDYPTDGHHGWKYIAFGPNGKLYIPVGAPCNVCERDDEIYSSITRIDPDGSNREVYAHGVRNTVGFDWHPETGELWFTENGRDWMGNDKPSCELNTAPRAGMHFGFPYCHEGTIPDPKFGDKRSCDEFIKPVQNLGPHVAPLGIEFYTGTQYPAKYRNQPIFAEHGSWNRDNKIGYRVMMVPLDAQQQSQGYEVFAEGWLQGEDYWGRPVDLELLPDGSMLLSDDYADVIYRIYYEG